MGDHWFIAKRKFHVHHLSFGVKKNPIMFITIFLRIFGSIRIWFLFSPNDLLNFPNLFINPLVIGTLIYCSVGSVCIAFVLQMIGQRYSPPNEA